MKKKERILIGISVLCMILTVVLGYSYALWTMTKEQVGMNEISSGCINITYSGENDIELTNTFPLTDSEGLATIPYTFTIENTCDLFANYQINLETFDVESGKTRMSDSYIKANLKQNKGNKFIDTLKPEYEVDPTINNATNAYKLAEGTLKGKASKTYNLRLWMDESVTQNDLNATDSTFNAKISVEFIATTDPFEESGTLKIISSSYNYYLWSYKENITEVEFQNKLEPITEAIESWNVSAINGGLVMAYLVPNESDPTTYKVYIQGKGGVKGNPDSSYLFKDFKKLINIKGLEYFDTRNVTDMHYMFYHCTNLTSLDLSSFDTSNVTNMSYMFNDCQSLTTLNISNFDTSKVKEMQSMFKNCINLTTLDISSFDTSKVKNMEQMFHYCSNLTTLDLSSFDTSNVTNMWCMFANCTNLTTLDVTNFDTSNVTNMGSMFNNCQNLTTLNISNFDTSKVTGMSGMFNNCQNLTNLDLSNFDTSNVIDMSMMFNGCTGLTELDLSNFDTSKVKEMDDMFKDCISLTILDISSFDTSNVKDVSSMFKNCSKVNTEIEILTTRSLITNASYYNNMFIGAATESGSQIKVYHTSENESLVNSMIATKSASSNIIKAGSIPDHTITINDSTVDINATTGYKGKKIIITPIEENKIIKSFKVNGNLMNGESFIMPNEDVEITDIILSDGAQTTHPYTNNIDNVEYFAKRYDGATSITVELTYQTESANYDWVAFYNDPDTDTIYNNKKYGGITLKTETITIPGDYIKIKFRSDSSNCNYYGFKALITPNYD